LKTLSQFADKTFNHWKIRDWCHSEMLLKVPHAVCETELTSKLCNAVDLMQLCINGEGRLEKNLRTVLLQQHQQQRSREFQSERST